MDVEAPRGLLRIFDELKNPRMDRTKLHALSDILFISLCAITCGADSWSEVAVYGRENKLHWSLDVTFREDTLRNRIGHRPKTSRESAAYP